MSNINWNGSRHTWRAKPAQSGRQLLSQTMGAGSLRPNYLTLAVALVTVAAGSAGATLLAMSLLAADTPELAAGSVELAVSEAVAAEPVAQASTPAPSIEEATEAAAPPAVAAPAETASDLEDASADEVAALQSNDPRWAQFEQPAPPLEDLRGDTRSGEASAYGSAGQSGGAIAAVKRAMQEPEEDPGQDAQETAAITPPPRAADPGPDAGSRQIVLNTAANVRSRANKSGKVLGAVPAGVKVASYGCRASWCEISYKGLRGWVYSGFVDEKNNKQSVNAAKPKATQAAAQRQKMQVAPAAKTTADNSLPGVKANEPLPTTRLPDRSGK